MDYDGWRSRLMWLHSGGMGMEVTPRSVSRDGIYRHGGEKYQILRVLVPYDANVPTNFKIVFDETVHRCEYLKRRGLRLHKSGFGDGWDMQRCNNESGDKYDMWWTICTEVSRCPYCDVDVE